MVEESDVVEIVVGVSVVVAVGVGLVVVEVVVEIGRDNIVVVGCIGFVLAIGCSLHPLFKWDILSYEKEVMKCSR